MAFDDSTKLAERVYEGLEVFRAAGPGTLFDKLVADGLINWRGEITTNYGGDADPVPAEVFTVEPDGALLSTLRFVTLHDRPVVVIEGYLLFRTAGDIGNDLSELVARNGIRRAPNIKIYHDRERDLVGTIDRPADGTGWRWVAGQAGGVVATIAEAFDALFAELRRRFAIAA